VYNFIVSNVLSAIHNIIAGQHFSLLDQAVGTNQVNRQGESFEVFARRAFANDFISVDEIALTKQSQAIFSYASSASNPPDFMIRGGDAIEVKKFESSPTEIQLNSSYPKAFLHSDYPLLTAECRNCEPWEYKDLVYVLAVIPKGSRKIREIWFVDGACYAAERDVYESIFGRLKTSIHSTSGLEISDSELGRVINVDPLQRTQLRIRGMWLIQHPRVAFQNLFLNPQTRRNSVAIRAILRETKFQEIIGQNNALEQQLEQIGCVLTRADVLNPNNRAKVMAVRTLIFDGAHA
jgi:NgoPII restriction endonuclease